MEQKDETYYFHGGNKATATLVCEEECVITHLSVKSMYRNRGLGSKILHAMETLAKELGYVEIAGQFSDSNQDIWESAQDFFVANGYIKAKPYTTHYAYYRDDFPWKAPGRTLPRTMKIIPFAKLQSQELDGVLTAFGEKISVFSNLLDMETSLTLWEEEVPLAYVLAAVEEETLVILDLGCGDTATGGSFYLLERLLELENQTMVQTQWPIPQVTPKYQEITYRCWKGW